MKCVFLGPPGAGKGTQAVRVGKEMGMPHISTGDMFRKAIAERTEYGMRAKEFMDRGELVPDAVVIELVRERIEHDDCRKGFLLDGFPRTIPQAEALDAVVDIDVVINIDAPDDAIVERLAGRRVCSICGTIYHVSVVGEYGMCHNCEIELDQRDDDREETVRNRLSVYHAQTQPLVEYYEKQGKLLTVDGTQDKDVTFKEIMSLLKGRGA